MNANASLGVAGLRKRRWKGYLLGLALTGVVLRGAEELTPTAQALLLAREAAEATAAEDNAAALAKLEAAFELRPDLPRIVLALASAQARAEQPEDAVATLKRAAALGIGARVEQQAEFAALRGRPDFKEVVRQFAANQNPKGEGEVAFSLSGVTGLIEGIAWREKTGMFYFADVNGRAVWLRQAKTGALRRLTPEGDELLGVYALAIDEAAGALWAATAGVAAMRDSNAEQNGSAALVEIDLESGAIRRSFALARGAGDEGTQHLLTHVALAPDGAVYATDRASPLVWRLAAGDNTLNVCAESPEFMALNAVAVVAEGGQPGGNAARPGIQHAAADLAFAAPHSKPGGPAGNMLRPGRQQGRRRWNGQRGRSGPAPQRRRFLRRRQVEQAERPVRRLDGR